MSHRLALAEMEERVEQIFAAIEELRSTAGDGKSKRELLDSIFRLVHNVKGGASASGLDFLVRVAHEFEGLLHALRVGQVRLDQEILRTFDQTAQLLLDSLGLADSTNETNHLVLLDRLQHLSKPFVRSEPDVETILNALPAEVRFSLSEEEKHSLAESAGEGASLYLVTTDFDITDFDRQFQLLKQRLTETGEVISTAPTVNAEHPGKINFRILYTRHAYLHQIINDLVELPDVTVNELLAASLPLTLGVDQAAGRDKEETPFHWSRRLATEESFDLIRIHLNDLDRLISSTHKLFRESTTFMDLALESPHKSVRSKLQKLAAGLSASFIELAGQIISLRMVSIDRVLQRALRSGRAAALAASKEIDFTVKGGDLLIDKSLSDAIADPLIHLVRNAVDHGIESAAERATAGKKDPGSVRIEAAATQGQTRVTVTDDGWGIDPSVVSQAAISAGVLAEGSLLDMGQSLRMIFRPGFSTADLVSSISGRGVGLDVVETAVEQVGGEVRVSTKPGAGSSFEIRLPVTFGLLEVVEITSSDRRYLLDSSQILSRRSIDSQDIEDTATGKVLRLENQLLPLVDLRELLGQAASKNEKLSLLLCHIPKEAADGRNSFGRVGVIVDTVGETLQVLVRNLGSRGARWFGVSGATELRDGTVVLLLDLPRLVNAKGSQEQ
jgi:two-component system chemotaxis sensor kinase CheA